MFRDSPVRREISRIEKCSRKCQRRITLNNAMSITPYPLLKTSRGGSNMGQFSVEISFSAGSVLGGNAGSVLNGNQQATGCVAH